MTGLPGPGGRTARAAVLDRFGPGAPLRLAEVPVAEPGPGQVRLRVQAAAVNPADVKIRANGGIDDARFPMILGWDAAGVVDAVGDEVTGWAVGDAAIALSRQAVNQVGTFTELVVLDAADMAPHPVGVDVLHAATLPLAAVTAQQALTAAHVPPGGTVLVVGAGGAVGGFACELAATAGLRVIATAADNDRPRLTAKHVQPEDVVDRAEPLEQAVRALLSGGVDAALNLAGPQPGLQALEAVRDSGAYITIVPGQLPAPQRGINPRLIFVQTDQPALAALSQQLSTGTLTTAVRRAFPLDQADDALQLAAAGGPGKVVLDVR